MNYLKGLLVLLLLVTLSSARLITKNDGPSSDHVIVIDHKLFYLSLNDTNMMTHEDTVAYCDFLGFELLDFATPEKERIVDEGIKNAGYIRRAYWTSGSRRTDGVWIWSNTGETMTYTNWVSEPQPEHNVMYFDSFRYSWHSSTSDIKNNFVCQQIGA